MEEGHDKERSECEIPTEEVGENENADRFSEPDIIIVTPLADSDTDDDDFGDFSDTDVEISVEKEKEPEMSFESTMKHNPGKENTSCSSNVFTCQTCDLIFKDAKSCRIHEILGH